MKIIDEKGKLFGKLNIIDLLVVLLVIAVAAVLAVRGLSKNDEAPNPEDTETGVPATLTFQGILKGVDPRYYDTVRQFVDADQGKKDQLMSNNVMLEDCYVVDCVATPHEEYVTTEDGQIKLVQSKDDKRLDLVFTVEAKVENSTTNVVGSQQVRVGASHLVKTTHFEFSVYVLSADWVTE